nr:hypothetical protein [Catenulispora rubra]
MRWRIDYQMASANLAALASSAVTERAASYGERWSDHAPVTCAYDWDLAAVPAPRHPADGELLSDAADHVQGVTHPRAAAGSPPTG